MVAPTDEIEIVAFVYRSNKDLYLALHNKKETRGGLPSECFYLAFVLNYRSRILLRLTIAQNTIEVGIWVLSNSIPTPHSSSFRSFLERKERKITTQTN